MYNKVSKFHSNPLTRYGDKNFQKKVHFSMCLGSIILKSHNRGNFGVASLNSGNP